MLMLVDFGTLQRWMCYAYNTIMNHQDFNARNTHIPVAQLDAIRAQVRRRGAGLPRAPSLHTRHLSLTPRPHTPPARQHSSCPRHPACFPR